MFGNAYLAEKFSKLQQIWNCNKLYRSNILPKCILFLPYHTICLEITYFASFTDYKDDVFEVISNWHLYESKFDRKINKFGGKSLKKNWTPQSSWSSFFPGLRQVPWIPTKLNCQVTFLFRNIKCTLFVTHRD